VEFEAAGRKAAINDGTRLMHQQGTTMVRHTPGGGSGRPPKRPLTDEVCHLWNKG